MRIKVDIDNVIRDMGDRMVAVYNSTYGETYTKEDITDYDVNVAFPKCEHARKFFFEEEADILYSSAVPMKDSIKGLRLAKELGHEIILVSYQPTRDSKERTLDWLQKYDIPYDALVFTNKQDKTIIEADYIIDDNPAFLDADPAKTVCIDWAYNRNGNYDYRVKSIYEFVKSELS